MGDFGRQPLHDERRILHLKTSLYLPTPRFPHYYQVERPAKVVLHHYIVKTYAEFKEGPQGNSAETPLAEVTQFGCTDLLWLCRH